MQHSISYQATNQFSKLILDYINEDSKLAPFINYFPKIENFEKQIKEKQQHTIDRGLLVKILEEQNKSLNLSELSKKNLNLLKSENTFSVTTGHQLCLFTGPLYFMYKIVSTINLCEKLSSKYSSYNFVPIFWMASEDHDFTEINHIHLFDNKIKWDTKQKGAVGQMTLEGLKALMKELRSLLGSKKHAEKLMSIFEKAYLNHTNLADATRYLINEFFGDYGLVIIDGNDKRLKQKFLPQIKKDILENGFFNTINKCSQSIGEHYKIQAFVRQVNFFKLCEGERKLLDSPITKSEIYSYPEEFSPNVLLRPLYQEIVLPNVSYVGGASEIAYWMQLRTAFKQEKIPFPILVLRNSALLLRKKRRDNFVSLGFQIDDLFLSEDVLNKRYLKTHSELDFTLSKERNALSLLYQKLALKDTDLGFQRSVEAQLQRQLNFMDKMQEKLFRNEKKRKEVAINQIKKIKKHLFPNFGLQERSDSFISFYLQDGENFIKILKDNFDPLSRNFVVLTLRN